MNNDQDLERALFRYGMIHPLLDDSLSPGEKSALRKQILSKTYDIPHSSRTTICERTLRQYLKWYREGGFSALMQCKRKDKGDVRAISEEVLKKAFSLKEELPTRSIREIIEMLELSGEVAPDSVKHSTLSRLVAQHTGQLRPPTSGKTFRRYQKENVNDTWQSDVKHCIYLPDPQTPKEYIKTYLIAFLDDKSRRVCGKIYWAENGANVEDCFRKALIQMGVPLCFYTDNSKIYKTKRLQTICAELGSQLKYCLPYPPQSKGKLEKFNAYVDRSFEPEARHLKIQTLEELNQYFEVWLTENYNHKVHAEIRRTPLEAHQSEQARLRYVTPEELRKIFIQRQVRKADNAATVSLGGNLYRVEGFLARKKVELRYDAKDLSCVEVYYNGQQYSNAEPLIIRANVWDGETESATGAPKQQDETAGDKTVQTSLSQSCYRRNMSKSSKTKPIVSITPNSIKRRMNPMYESYFGFSKTPFIRDIDVKQLYLHADFQELKGRLQYAIENRLFAAVTGEVGSGKTTAIRAVVEEINPVSHKIIYISQSDMSPKAFYNEILEQIDMTPSYFKPESKRKVNKAMLELYQHGNLRVKSSPIKTYVNCPLLSLILSSM